MEEQDNNPTAGMSAKLAALLNELELRGDVEDPAEFWQAAVAPSDIPQ
jgi:hypothetical protein